MLALCCLHGALRLGVRAEEFVPDEQPDDPVRQPAAAERNMPARHAGLQCRPAGKTSCEHDATRLVVLSTDWFVPVPGGPTAINASDAQIVQAAQ